MVATPGQNSLEVHVTSSGVSEFRHSMTEAVGGLLSLRTAAFAAGGAMAALGAAGIAEAVIQARQWNSVVREMTKVTNPQVAQELSAQMVTLAETIPLPTEKLGDLAVAAARFGIAKDDIEPFVETVARMAVATDISVDQAGKAFARLSKLTDTPISHIENLGASINQLGQTTATSSASIVNGMLRSSAALRQLGLSGADIAGINAALIEVSESAERAGTRLRRLAQELADPRKLRAIATGFAEINGSVINMNSAVQDQQAAVDRANQRLDDERSTLTGLQTALDETSDKLKGLSDAHDELSGSIADNRIKIQEIRYAAEKEGRDLTDSEKKQIKELQIANDGLRIQQAKVGRQMDKTRKKREQQSEAVTKQKDAVDSATQSVQDETQKLSDVSFNVLQQMFADDPAKAIITLANAMAEGGDKAQVLRKSLSAVSTQALAALGENSSAIDTIDRANNAFDKGTSLMREYQIDAHSVSSELERMTNAMENLAAPVGNKIIPFLKQGIVGFTDFTEALRRSADGGAASAMAIGLVGTALGGVGLIAGAAFLPSIGAVVEGLAGLTLSGVVGSVIGGLAAVVLALNPVTLAILAIAGTVAAFALAWKDDIGGVREFAADELGQLTSLFQKHFGRLFGPGGSAQKLIQSFQDFWSKWGDDIVAVAKFVADTVFGVIKFGFDAIATFIEVFVDLITGDWKGAWLVMGDFVVRTLNGILSFASKWGGKLLDAIIGALPKSLRNAIKSALGVGKGEHLTIKAPEIKNPFGEQLAKQQKAAKSMADYQAALNAKPPSQRAGAPSTSQQPGQTGATASGTGTGSSGNEQVVIHRSVIQFAGDGEISDALAKQANEQLDRQRRAVTRKQGRP